ncbi:MAG TPA: helix-turn-helix transcriptional regulator [Rhodanobacteraceae bacterium]|nr:helix-turn-helix transcriptional regulator [Rhodanobacteraceae bacterium]
MHNDATLAIRDNVRRLMNDRGMSQRALAKAAGVSQSSVGYLLRYRDINDRHPTTSTIEAIAGAFGVQTWQLLIPEMPLELLTSPRMAALLLNYKDAAPEGRANLERIAESEKRYALSPPEEGERKKAS